MSKSASRKELLTSGQAQLMRNDRILFFILLAHLPFTMLVIPLGYGTQGFAIYASAIVGFTSLALYLLLRGTPAFGILSAILLMALSAIMIQSQLGRTEMHFHIFVALAILTIYRSWACILAAAAAISLHHVILTFVQLRGGGMDGMPIMLYSDGCTWEIALLHITFVVLEAAILIYYAILMRRDTRVSEMLMEAVSSIERDNDLRVRIPAADRHVSVAVFNGLTRKLARLMTDIRGSAEKVQRISRELTAIARSAESETSPQLGQGRPTSTTASQIPSHPGQVAQHVQDVVDLGSRIDEQAADGHERFNRAVRSTMDLQEIMADATESIQRLKDNAASMDTVIDVLAAISSQADQLAGEAAHAEGDAQDATSLATGAGTLARLTQDSSAEIHQIIQRLQREIEDSASKMHYSQQKTTEASSEILHAGMVLNEILESISRISEMCTDISKVTGGQTGMVAGLSPLNRDAADQDPRDLSMTLIRKATRLKQVADTLSRLASAYRYE